MKKLFYFSLFQLILLLPQVSSACTVCFGGADSNLQRGFFWGIVVLGALPFLLISFFVGTLIVISRKNKRKQTLQQ